MKYIKTTLLSLFLTTCLIGQAQPGITSDQWREDLSYLKQLIDHKYPHLYTKVSKADFHKSIAALHEDIPQLTENEIMVGFARLIAQFKIGHSGISLASAMHGESLKTGFHNLPLNFYLFRDGVYIQAAADKYAKAVGAKVLRIGNTPIDQAMRAIQPVVSMENEQFFKAYGIPLLGCPELLQVMGVIEDTQVVPLLLSRDGEEFEMAFPGNQTYHIPNHFGLVDVAEGWITAHNPETAPLYLKDLNNPYSFSYLPESRLVYVRQGQIRNGPGETIQQFYSRIFEFVEHNEVDRFVLDVRQNGGGNNYLNKPIILGLIKSKINEKGKLFTIIGRRTFSAAQNLVNELEQYTETTFIGEPTAENVNFWGDVNIEKLPNSQLPVRLSYMWWQDLDPRDKRVATVPDVLVEPSFEDYSQHHDPVLAAVLNYTVPDKTLIKGLRELYVQQKFREAEKLVRAFMKNQANQHLSEQVEKYLNALGYEMINSDNTASIAVLKLNTELFPGSANTWDSLGESYLNAYEFEKAINSYEKAIAIDGDGITGEHAREMLNRIKQHRSK